MGSGSCSHRLSMTCPDKYFTVVSTRTMWTRPNGSVTTGLCCFCACVVPNLGGSMCCACVRILDHANFQVHSPVTAARYYQKRSLTHNAPVSLCCGGCSTSVKQMQERACSSFRTRRVYTIPCTRKTRQRGPLPRMHAARFMQHAPLPRAPSRVWFANYWWVCSTAFLG